MALRLTMRRRCDMPVEPADDARRKAEPTSDWFPTSTSSHGLRPVPGGIRSPSRPAVRRVG